MIIIFRVILTFNATSLLILIYLVQKGITIPLLIELNWPNLVSYGLFSLIPFLLTLLSIWFSQYLGFDDFKKGQINSIEHANNSFLPSYLGYFFVGLSLENLETFLFVYVVLFVFTFLSQALYFNPLFLLFKFDFYNIKTVEGAAIFLISKKKYKLPSEIEIKKAFRINNYTFIERD